MIKKLLLPHQGYFMQSPFLFPEKRYHMLVAGYGAGKTSSIALSVENQVKMLQGKRDREGHRPRLLLGGVTLSHLEKTTLGYITQDLENSKTRYKHDSKNNILRVGDVDIILVALQSPSEIVGFDVWGSNLDEIDDLGLSAGADVTFEAVKSVNERTRQIIPGMRKPFITMGCFATGTEVMTAEGYQSIETIAPGTLVMTRLGFRRVLRQWQTGLREVMKLHGVCLTPEHRVWDEAKKDWIEAQYIGSSSICMVSSYDEVEKWKKLLLSTEQGLGMLRSVLTEYSTTGTIKKQRSKDIIEVTQVVSRARDYMLRYTKASTEDAKSAVSCIIETATQVIIALKTLSVSLKKNITPTTAVIDTLSTFVLCAERSSTPDRQTQLCVENANSQNEYLRKENGQGKSAQVHTKAFGKNSKDNIPVSIARLCSFQAEKMHNDAASVPDCASTSKKKTDSEKNVLSPGKDYTPACVLCAEKHTLQKGAQCSAAKNVATGQELLECLRLLIPATVKGLVSAEKYSGRAEGTKEVSARLVPVYDLEVEDCHEFFVHTDVGDILVHNSTSQGQKGLYRLYTQYKKSGTGFVLIRGRTKDNWYLDDTYVNSMYDMYNERERLVYLEGHFLSISQGHVFGDFDWERNYIDLDMGRSVADDEVLYWAQDFNQGYHRGQVYVVRGNTIYCLKRYEFPEIRHAPGVLRNDFPRQKILFLPDTTAKEEIAHFARELGRHNISLITRTKNPIVEDSAFLVNKLLYTGRLIITKAAKETAEALSLQQRDKNGQIQKGVGMLSPVHDTDGVRLACYFLACNKKEFADIRRVTVERNQWMESESQLRTLNSGYYEIGSNALR